MGDRPFVTYRAPTPGRPGLIEAGQVSCELYANAEGVTWHTFDRRGTGGENDTCHTLQEAKREACLALLRQHAYARWRGPDFRIGRQHLDALMRLAWSREGREQEAIDAY